MMRLWGAVLLCASAAAAISAQAARPYTPPRTAGGQPDLQGIWNNATITPLERPADLAGKAIFTPAEAAAYEKQMLVRNDVDRRPKSVDEDVNLGYNAAWWDRGTHIVATRRTSLIVDPEDGRLPEMTADGKARAAALADYRRLHPADGPEDRSLGERCLLWPTAGPPMMPGPYNSNYQIFQTPGYVVIEIEMIHEPRIIQLDSRPHLPSAVEQWKGDSRGHWEGDTLVVETTNFTGKTRYRGTSEKMRLTERFRRTAPDTLLYEFTVDDPATYTRPWTAQMTMSKTTGPLYEYACHEGNYGMANMLLGARAEERKSGK